MRYPVSKGSRIKILQFLPLHCRCSSAVRYRQRIKLVEDYGGEFSSEEELIFAPYDDYDAAASEASDTIDLDLDNILA